MKRVFLIMLVALAIVGVASASRSTDSPTTEGLTFDQAVAAGIVPSLEDSLKQSGLPRCTDGDKPNVYKSWQDLLRAEQPAPEGPQCMADPRKARFFRSGGPAAPDLTKRSTSARSSRGPYRPSRPTAPGPPFRLRDRRWDSPPSSPSARAVPLAA